MILSTNNAVACAGTASGLDRCVFLLLVAWTLSGCNSSDSDDPSAGANANKNLWANIRLQKDEDGQVVIAEIERADDVPEILGTLEEHAALNELVLQECGLIEPHDIAAMVALKNVSTIEFINCEIEADGLAELANVGKLQKLVFSSTPLTDKTIAALKACPQLEDIRLRAGGFDYAALSGLQFLPQLVRLQIDRRNFELTKFSSLSDLPQLQSFNLPDTMLTDADLAALPEMPELRTFEFVGKQISDAGLAQLKKLPKLESLDLEDAQVTAAGLEPLIHLTGLKSLDLAGCRKVTDEAVSQLHLCAALEELRIVDTKISGAAFVQLAQLKTLRKVTVQSKVVSQRQVDAFLEELPDCDVIRIKPPPRPGG